MKFFTHELEQCPPPSGLMVAKVPGARVIVRYRLGAWIASLHFDKDVALGLVVTESVRAEPGIDRAEEALRLLEGVVRRLRTKLEGMTVPESTRVDSVKPGP